MLRLGVVLLVSILSFATVLAQTAIPTREGRGGQAGQGGQGRRGGGPGPEINLPATPVAAPLPTISAEITGPGPIFESLMELKPGDDMAHFKYEAHEYFVSGTANGQPYTTRIVIRRPADAATVQRSRARRVDASERQCLDVSLHARLLDDDGTRRPRHPDEHERPVRRVQLRALQESAGRSGTGARDPRAGRRADEVETAGKPAGRTPRSQDDSRRDLSVGGGAHQLSARAHGASSIRHEADLSTASCRRARAPPFDRSTCR